MLGDSVAAGLGADTAADTVAGVLVRAVLESSGRPVTMTNHAVVGARSSDLDRQVTRCLSARPHVAVIIIGANDVTHMVPRALAARRLETAIARLIDAGTAVVVGTCPDLGTVRPVGPPLKWVARERSRSLAAAQRRAATRVGAHPVSLYDQLGPEFEANAEAFFGPDRFHPSSHGLPPDRRHPVAPGPGGSGTDAAPGSPGHHRRAVLTPTGRRATWLTATDAGR